MNLGRTLLLIALVVQQTLCVSAGTTAATVDARLPWVPVFDLSATRQSDGILVRWMSGSEVQLVGYRLYRRTGETAPWTPVTDQLLPGLIGHPEGGRYRFLDSAPAVASARQYRLDAVDLKGRSLQAGIVNVDPESKTLLAAGEASPATGWLSSPLAPGFQSAPHQAVLEFMAGSTASPAALASADIPAPAAAPPMTSSNLRMKIETRDTGLYLLSVTDIASRLSMPLDEVTQRLDRVDFRLGSQGSRRAYVMATNSGGVLVYNEGFHSTYTDDNVFWLERGQGLVLPPITNEPPAVAAGTNEVFRDTPHFEQDLLFDYNLGGWVWQFIAPGLVNPAVTNAVPLPGAAPDAGGLAHFKIRFKARNDALHNMAVDINGNRIGETSWSGVDFGIWESDFDPAFLLDGTNILMVTGLAATGGYSIVYLDWYEISYPRHFTAVQDKLAFRTETLSDVTLRGFTSSDVRILDITDPLLPREHLSIRTEPDGVGFAASFRPTATNRSFLAFAAGAESAPGQTASRAVSTLRSATNRADYVVITRANLLSSAVRLAQHRGSNGWTTATVDFLDLCDEFTHGIVDADAIPRFLAHATRNWNLPPECVVLAGAGTFDFRNTGNLAAPKNLIPVKMADTFFGQYAADNLLADFDGDAVPDVAIGRLPALNTNELDKMVDRLLAYDSESAGSWSTNTLWVCDNADDAGNFPAYSDPIAALLPTSFQVSKLYLYTAAAPEPTPPYYRLATLKPLLKSGLNDGGSLVNYRGHGSWNVWAGETMLNIADVRALTNGVRRPLVVAPSCSINWFEHPSFRCMGEEFLLSNNGGAIAVWAPSGLSLNDPASLFDRLFMQARYEDNIREVGPAIREAATDYHDQNGLRMELELFNLLGDPAILLK